MPGKTIELGGVTVSNPDKALYPAAGFSKKDVVAYYLSVAPFILPHLKNRSRGWVAGQTSAIS
jgi:bifunctional non-homologous end joining protein LigD